MSRIGVVTALFAMALVLSLGAGLSGTLADRLRRRRIGPETLAAMAAILFITAQVALVPRLPLPAIMPWLVVALLGASTVLSFTIIAEYFVPELTGRANGSLNVLLPLPT